MSVPESLPSLIEALRLRAADMPDGLAFEAAGERLTWATLLEDVRRAGSSLAARGVTAGSRCAIVLGTGLAFVRAFYGLQLLGASPVALNPRLPAALIRKRLQELGCDSIVAEAGGRRDLDDACAGAGVRVIAPGTFHGASPLPWRLAQPPDPEAVSHLQVTSGTTGAPRAAVILNRNVMAAAAASKALVGARPDDVMVGWLPLHHDFGLIRFVAAPPVFGCGCHLVESSIAAIPAWLRTISRVRATITGAPDFAFRVAARLVAADRVDLRSLRVATSGGEPVRLSSITAFETHFGIPDRVRPAYGLAEATLGVAGVVEGERLRVDASGTPSCGRPMHGVELRIGDDGGRALPSGERGEILVKGPGVFAGYLDDPAGTAQVLRDGWLRTGDIGCVDADGHLFVHGRRRAMIKRGGASIAPREIEEVVDALSGVRRSAAVGVPGGEHASTERVIVVAEVERRLGDDVRRTLSSAIVEHVRQAMGFAPGDVRLVQPGTLPLTASGKIRYEELRASLQER